MRSARVHGERVAVELELTDGCLGLVSLDPMDPKENKMVFGDDGESRELACWDASVEIRDGAIYCSGCSRGHGMGGDVELIIPLALVSDFKVNFEALTPDSMG